MGFSDKERSYVFRGGRGAGGANEFCGAGPVTSAGVKAPPGEGLKVLPVRRPRQGRGREKQPVPTPGRRGPLVFGIDKRNFLDVPCT